MKQSYAIVHFRDDADGVFAGKQCPADVEFKHEMRRGGEIEFKLGRAAFVAYKFVLVSVQDEGKSVCEKLFRGIFVALLLAVRLAIFERSHTIVLFEQILEV